MRSARRFFEPISSPAAPAGTVPCYGGVFILAATSDRPAPRRRRNPVLAITAGFFKVLGTLLLIGLITGVILACFAATYIKTVIMPQAPLEGNFVMDQSSVIYYPDASTGQYVEHLSLHGTENRKMVTYDQIPTDLVNATIAIEDKTFRTHKGVNWRRTLYGVFLMFTGQDIQGGSTITQQFIKNFTHYDDVTVKRKILEIFRALEFDATYSKNQIMEWYLNYIYLGDNCYGVATAAENYFNKDLSQLTLAECASLISITNNPTIYGPYSQVRMTDPKTGETTTGLERNKKRQELVLWEMYDQGLITESQYYEAKAEQLVFTRSADADKPATLYNWYDEQVLTDVINDLMDKYGYSKTLATDMVTSGGLKIYACVDVEMQTLVEQVYADRSNLDLVSDSGQKIQSAIVVVDPDGNVVALAGALGEKELNRVWNYASRSTRQPGSSIKPLSVYAPALELGIVTPATVYDDYPVQVLGGSAWPVNSYGYFRGRMNVAEAVEDSSNPVAVRVFQELTPELSFQFTQDKFGISTLESGREANGNYKSDLGPAQLALGGLTDGVRVIDMAAAYASFPREGVYLAPRTYTKVTQEVDGQEVVLLDNTTNRQGDPIMSSRTAWYMNQMLTQVVQSGTGTQAQIPGQVVAGKTGSTTSNCDRWFVGYTGYYTAAVWVGYDRPERIKVTPGSNPAAILWQTVMRQVHEGLESRSFSQPSGLVTVQYCKDSGMKATALCARDPRGSRVGTAQLFEGDGPIEDCTMHVEVEVCTACPVLDSEGKATGAYRLAGQFCPREPIEGVVEEPTVKTITVLDYDRENIDGRSARDSAYLKRHLDALGTCTTHTELIEPIPQPYDTFLFDITDPATWPTQAQWPGFDPADPSTYPMPPEPDPPVTTSPTPTPDVPGPETPIVPPPDTPTTVDPPLPPEPEPYLPADALTLP